MAFKIENDLLSLSIIRNLFEQSPFFNKKETQTHRHIFIRAPDGSLLFSWRRDVFYLPACCESVPSANGLKWPSMSSESNFESQTHLNHLLCVSPTVSNFTKSLATNYIQPVPSFINPFLFLQKLLDVVRLEVLSALSLFSICLKLSCWQISPVFNLFFKKYFSSILFHFIHFMTVFQGAE